jgi:hypothetical protein
MSLVVAWVAFPLVLVVLALGHGLLIARIAGGVPGTLLLPLGLAGIVVASQLPTYWDWSAELTTPLVLVLAAAGFVLSRGTVLALRLDLWAAAAAVGVFLVVAAPVVLSGEATFAGYTVLGDTSIHFIGSDHLLEHGRRFGELAPSSYEYSLANYYGAGAYPSGGPTAVGAVRPLVGEDVAWIFQPFLSVLVATMALSLYSLLQGVVELRPFRALAAFIAAQPALVLAYALQGSVKEIGAVWSVALMAALLPVFAKHRDGGARTAIPLAVAGAACIAFVGLAAGVWIAPVALVALFVSVRRARRNRWSVTAAEGGVFVGLLAVLSFQSLGEVRSYLDVAGGVVTNQAEFGNLLGPLDPAQIFGTWLSGDYRVAPVNRNLSITHALIALTAFSGLLGLAWLVRRRKWWPAVFIGISLLAWAYVTRTGSPWADGKALMIASPAVVLAAMLGPPALFSVGRRVEALVLAVVVSAGVLASNAFAYHDVSLAPRDRLTELERIGEQIDGEGPTLYTEFEEFGKHFLRAGDPEGSSEGWQRRYRPLRNGQFARQGFSYDLDEFALDYVLEYPTIVVRRSPAASRPPSNYRRTFSGRFYDVWQREPRNARSVIQHIPLGSQFERGGVPSCREVGRIAQTAASRGAQLAYSPAPQASAVLPAQSAFPPNWFVDGAEGHILRPRGPGKVEDSTVINEPGMYDLWIMGSFGRGYEVWLDGRPVGGIEHHLNGRGQYGYVATVDLEAGRHVATLFRRGGSPTPEDGVMEMLGPIVLSKRIADEYSVRYVEPGDAASLCGRPLDWLEIIR